MTDWFDRATSFDAFQAIRLLHRLAPQRPVVGRSLDPREEPLRFASNVTFEFSASDLQRIDEPRQPGGVPRVLVNYLGLATPASKGSLPVWYSRLLLDAERDGNRAMRDFLDLFNHRLLSLFFRARLKHEFAVQYELERGGAVRRVLGALVGLGTRGVTERLRLDPRALLRHVAVFVRKPASAAGIVLVLQAWFGVPFEIDPFVLQLVPLETGEQTRLDGSRALGRDVVLGRGVLSTQGCFRLRVGPLDHETFREFLPGGARLPDLQELVRTMVGAEFDYDLRLVLREDAVPRLRLGGDPASAGRLGWSSWLGVRLQGGDAADTLVPASHLEGSPR